MLALTVSNVFLSIYAIGLVITGAMFLLLATLPPSRYQKELTYTIVFAGIMQLGYFFSSTGSTLEELMIAQKLIYLGGSFVPYTLTLLFATFCRITLHKPSRMIMYFGSVLMAVIAMTCDINPLMHKAVSLSVSGDACKLAITPGPLMYWFNFRCIVYFITMAIFAIRNMRRSSRRRNIHSVILMQTATLPYALYLIEAIWKPAYSIAPIGLTLGIILLMVLVFVVNIYDLRSYVRDEIFAESRDAIIMFSIDGSFQSCNPLALKMFPSLGRLSVGEAIDDKTLSVLNAMKNGTEKEYEFEEQSYECEVRKVKKEKLEVGTLLMLKDVTAHRSYVRLMEKYQHDLEATVQEKTKHIRAMQDHIIMSMSDIIENRDGNTGGHVKRTSAVVKILMDYLVTKGYPEITPQFSNTVVHTAPMHDLGKLAIADNILCKNGKLTDDEFEIMKTHTVIGKEIVDKVLKNMEEEEVLEISQNIAMYHHEKWNGKGYPEHLAGTDIPLEARLMAIADVYDALVSKRCYKEAMSYEMAHQIMSDSFGSHFDPNLQECFEACCKQIEAYYDSYYEAS